MQHRGWPMWCLSLLAAPALLSGCQAEPPADSQKPLPRSYIPIPTVTCLGQVSRTEDRFTVRFKVENTLDRPILFLWTEAIPLPEEDSEGRLKQVYSQSLRWYGALCIYSNPTIHMRPLAPGEAFTFTSTYGTKRLVAPLKTEFAFAKDLPPKWRDWWLAMEGSTTYRRTKRLLLISVTTAIHVTCPDIPQADEPG
jgi:hypothetical protein